MLEVTAKTFRLYFTSNVIQLYVRNLGTYADFGNFDQCLSVSASIDDDLSSLTDDVVEGREDSERVAFQGKYCLLTFGAQLSTASHHDRSTIIVGVGDQTKPLMDFSAMFKNTSTEGTVRISLSIKPKKYIRISYTQSIIKVISKIK